MELPRRILVTGAGGFVGRHLLQALAVTLPNATVMPAKFDVRDAASVLAEVRAMRPDACIHLAAISAIPVAQSDPATAWRVNLCGTITLARALAAEAPGCTLLFVSTAEAYGRSFIRGVELDETAALEPVNVYGATKAAADLALGATATEALPIIRARPFNHTGPGQSDAFVVANFARQIARIAAGLQKPVLRVGALDARRDFLDVRDVCAFYVQCLVQAKRVASGAVMNVASGTPRRIGDILDELLDLAGVRAQIEVDPSRLRQSEIVLAVGDATKARELLGWVPVITWRQTLTDVLSDWRNRVETEIT